MHPERASVTGTMGDPSVTGAKRVTAVQLVIAPYVHRRVKMVTVLFLAPVFVMLDGTVSTVPSTLSAMILWTLARMHWYAMFPLALSGMQPLTISLALLPMVCMLPIRWRQRRLLSHLKRTNLRQFFS